MGGNGGSGCSLCRVLNTMLGLAFLGAGAYLIWYFLGRPSADDVKGAWNNFGGFGDFSDVLGNLTDSNFGGLFGGDPFLSDNSTKAWKNEGQGLQLEVVNALDDTWQDEFTLAISDWENGDPDALSLTTTRGEVDYSCKEQEGVLKVCNGNFGDTGWLGINDLLFIEDTGEVLSSVAKMNEYYLRNAENAKRQFTMCHEIGHGWGLPHTDETFTNPSTGECMDYTNKPEENMHPNGVNYRRLVSIYGTVSSGRRQRGLRQLKARQSGQVLTDDLRQEYREAMAEIEQLSVRRALSDFGYAEATKWEMVNEHPRGSTYERPLGDKYYIQANLLHEFDALN